MENKQMTLTKELHDANTAYRNTGIATMSDKEYDGKLEELKKLEEESGIKLVGSPTDLVGAEAVDSLEKAKHEYPALSLDKVKYKDREDLIKWLDDKQGIISWKCDGLTVVLTYDNGILTSAVTRGNGEEGNVITHNARFFEGVPQETAYKGHLVVRGEAMMTFEEFKRVNTEAGGIYENPRNLAAATIQMLDANESRKRRIIFRAFELVSPGPSKDVQLLDFNRGTDQFYMAFMQDRLDWLQFLGFSVVDRERCDASDILGKIEQWKEDIPNLAFPTDGLVISYNDMVYGMSLGNTGHHFRHSMALKWTDETQSTTIWVVKWSVGKTGQITPVALFDPEVRLGLGSNVSKASLHNLSVMEKLGVKRGCRAEVYLANLIIPQVYSADGGKEAFEIPDRCPVCGEPTRIEESNGVKVLHCDNENCSARQIGNLLNTFGKDGLYAKGLGESQITDLLEAGFVTTDPLSFYDLVDDIKWLEDPDYLPADHYETLKDDIYTFLEQSGWGGKKWVNLLAAIDESRNTTLQKFLYSLNIPLLGNDLSKKLAKHWGNIEGFKAFLGRCAENCEPSNHGYDAAIAELTAIDGVGPEKARFIAEWADALVTSPERYQDFMRFIKALKFNDTVSAGDNPLAGLTFVITGAVHIYKNRDEFKASVEARGGKVSSTPSKVTTALVNNDINSTSGKNKKARELGLEIISEEDFIARYGK